MIGTPIAFGLTMIVCFTLFYYYWRIRQLRARLVAAQNTPAPDDFPVEFGIGENVVETFPTIKASDLKCTASEDLQCPICLVEYEDWEVLRQLPFCHHIFHTVCVGAWFEKQTTCPVCRMSMSKLTESFGDLVAAESMRIMHCRGGQSPPSSDVTVEVISDNSTAPCPSGIFRNDTEALKTEQLMAVQRRGDFHVVSIPQPEDRRHTCYNSTCKLSSLTKPIKSLHSGDFAPETRHQSVDQIPVQIQESIQTKTQESNDSVSCQGVSLISQETLEFAATQPTVVDTDDPRRNSGDVRVSEDVQTLSELSFEFQPVVTADGGLQFRATTL